MAVFLWIFNMASKERLNGLPRKKGAKIVFSPIEIEKVKKLAFYHLNTEQIADIRGVNRDTFFQIMNRQPEVRDAFNAGRANLSLMATQKLSERIKEGDLTAIIFYLKTKQGLFLTKSKIFIYEVNKRIALAIKPKFRRSQNKVYF